MSETRSVQERYAPRNHCFGCGPVNPKGLHVRSFEAADGLEAEWMPEPHHEAFDGAVSGGVLGTLLDCHSNWAAALHLMKQAGRDAPPCTVTSEFHVRLLRVTPSDGPLRLRARVVESLEDRATVEATVEAAGRTTATCRGVFVAVKQGHPAFHRW
ncbi:MAG: PaaI family thioesterase [Betaproteobacteria bacterium]